MRVSIIAIGKMKSGPERELVERYLSRARASGKNLGLQDFNVIEFGESRAGAAPARKADEARMILGAVPKEAALIVLDEGGRALTSQKFAGTISTQNDNGKKHLIFVIGGPDGLDNSVRERAQLILSFSPLTWPHQIVRLLLGEQLYRATTILSNHPYHRA
ncbi:MAG TPA: 23S rRNA (pseudouridine(1915)-N(3))-methyltransferase RlmH [Devosia sp.]|nr:23S rRNA (pseudouridine(1915)-N(3))-methyltransferase RlmH [Devosia sp.]